MKKNQDKSEGFIKGALSVGLPAIALTWGLHAGSEREATTISHGLWSMANQVHVMAKVVAGTTKKYILVPLDEDMQNKFHDAGELKSALGKMIAPQVNDILRGKPLSGTDTTTARQRSSLRSLDI